MRSRHLVQNDLQERSTVEQKRDTAAQGCAYPSTGQAVVSGAPLQSGALSAQKPDEAAHEKCVTGVQRNSPLAAAPVLPPELAGVVTAWPTLPEHIKAAVLALVATARPGTDGTKA